MKQERKKRISNKAIKLYRAKEKMLISLLGILNIICLFSTMFYNFHSLTTTFLYVLGLIGSVFISLMLVVIGSSR